VRTTQKGTKTVAAPATVSGLPFIVMAPQAPRHWTEWSGKEDERCQFVSQETCRQALIHRHGRGCPEQELDMSITCAFARTHARGFPDYDDGSICPNAGMAF